MSSKVDFHGDAAPIPKGCTIGMTNENGIVKATIDLEKATTRHLIMAFAQMMKMKEEYDSD